MANDPKDKASIDQIRTHLGHIAKMFVSWNFKAANAHSRHKSAWYGEHDKTQGADSLPILGNGSRARIRLLTSSPETTDAVHVLFQVIDHRTQDVPTISDDLPKN